MTILWVLFFIFFTGDVQIVVQIVLDKGGNVSAYKSPSQETIKVILSQSTKPRLALEALCYYRL